MRVPVALVDAFKKPFEETISRFATERGLLPEPAAIHSPRFVARSIIPHVQKLSDMFNRRETEPATNATQGAKDAKAPGKPRKPVKKGQKTEKDAEKGLAPYWKETSNPENLRLAYFLYFMPSNLFRMASVWSELARLGFRWPEGKALSAIEFGAGPATGACGIAAGEHHSPTGLPASGTWALIEQDKAMLELGSAWAQTFFAEQERPDWGVRPFHRKISLQQGFLPRSAPRFNLWLTSFFLNELTAPPAEIARGLLDSWERHLDDEGLAILVEPALKAESRRLLQVRQALIEEAARRRIDWLQVLLPCMGTQACGALADADDWCHEEVSWWRPPYFAIIDRMAGLDRKSLPFSYLVIARSKRPVEAILPAIARSGAGSGAGAVSTRYRLVSPTHFEGKEQEFFICGADGKRRARYRATGPEDPAAELERGDVLLDAEIRGDTNAGRLSNIKKRV